METLQHQRELLQNEVQKSINKMLTAEERAHQMDLLLAQEEEKIKSLERELENLRDSQVCVCVVCVCLCVHVRVHEYVCACA